MKRLAALVVSVLLVVWLAAGCAGGLTKDASFEGLEYKLNPNWIELTDDANSLGGNSVTYVAKGQTDRLEAFLVGGAIIISASEFPDEAIPMYGEEAALEEIASMIGESADAFTVIDPLPEGANIAWSWAGEMFDVPAQLEILQGGGKMYLTMCGGTGELADSWKAFTETFRIADAS